MIKEYNGIFAYRCSSPLVNRNGQYDIKNILSKYILCVEFQILGSHDCMQLNFFHYVIHNILNKLYEYKYDLDNIIINLYDNTITKE